MARSSDTESRLPSSLPFSFRRAISTRMVSRARKELWSPPHNNVGSFWPRLKRVSLVLGDIGKILPLDSKSIVVVASIT